MTDEHDSAALGTAALAGALTIIAEPGPYDLLNLITGVTILLILWSYEYQKPRGPRKSLAFAAVCAFVAILVLGPIFEYFFSFNQHYSPKNSRVDSWLIAIFWGMITAVVYFHDKKEQSKRTVDGSYRFE